MTLSNGSAKATWRCSLATVNTKVSRAAKFTTHVPVHDLVAAAGRWGPEGIPQTIGWLETPNHRLKVGERLRPCGNSPDRDTVQLLVSRPPHGNQAFRKRATDHLDAFGHRLSRSAMRSSITKLFIFTPRNCTVCSVTTVNPRDRQNGLAVYC